MENLIYTLHTIEPSEIRRSEVVQNLFTTLLELTMSDAVVHLHCDFEILDQKYKKLDSYRNFRNENLLMMFCIYLTNVKYTQLQARNIDFSNSEQVAKLPGNIRYQINKYLEGQSITEKILE